MSGQESQAEPASDGTGQASSKPPTCYNCGANDHFMMACPEPTRTIPAGLEAARAAQAAQAASGKENPSQASHHRFSKRHKSYGGPVVTRYPAPRSGPVVTRYGPSPAPYNNSPQTYPAYGAYAQPPTHPYHQGPPLSQPPHVQYPQYVHPQASQPYSQPYGPIPMVHTPPYGQAAAYQYPPQGALAPQYQQGYQQPYSTTSPAYPPQHHGPYNIANAPSYKQPGGPIAPPANAYPQPSPSPYPNHAQNHGVPIHQQISSHPPQYQGAPHQQGPTPTSQGSPSTPYPPQSFQASPTQPLSATNHTSRSSSISTTSHVLGSGSQTYEQDEEEAEFNWMLQRVFREPKSRPADAIRTPLPSVFDDDIILPPSYGNPFVISKYAKPDNVEEFCKSVRDTDDWTDLQHDPAFKEVDRAAPFILFEELAAWSEEQQRGQEAYQGDENSEDVFECHESSASRKRAWPEELGQGYPRKRHVSFHRQSPISNNGKNIETEPKHANRVSNIDSTAAKTKSPATPSMEMSSTPATEESGSLGNNFKNDVWAPELGEGDSTPPAPGPKEELLAPFEVNGVVKSTKQKPPGFSPSDMSSIQIAQDRHKNYRQDSGYVSARGSYSNGGEHSAWDQPRNHEDYRSSKHGNQAPPLLRYQSKESSRQIDGTLDSPESSNSSHEPAHQKDFADPDASQEYQDDGMSSPLSPTSAELLGFSQPSSQSDARNRRGNGNSRNKRRQPRVADAYSRRW